MRAILLISCTGFAICIGSWSFIESIDAILVTRLASGIFFGGIVDGLRADDFPDRFRSASNRPVRRCFQAVAFGLAAILANLIGGILYASVGPVGVFGGAALCAALGGVIGFAAVPVAVARGGPAVAVEATPAVN